VVVDQITQKKVEKNRKSPKLTEMMTAQEKAVMDRILKVEEQEMMKLHFH
jgi:hypothetical protein